MAVRGKPREQGLPLEEDDDTAGFLGVTMDRNDWGLIELEQVGLVDRILEALDLDTKLETNELKPLEHDPVVKDTVGEGPQGSFSYSSVVGMLLYLSGHSQPDIAYTVNCCARYVFNLRLSHEKAIKRIGRYLKATRDKGLIMRPSSEFKVEAFPDADFAGLYGYEKSDDPTCTKSRTGFLLNVSDFPVLWISKLQ